MTENLVTKLREEQEFDAGSRESELFREAANEIEVLRQRVAELEDQINTGFYGRMSAKLQQQLAACEAENAKLQQQVNAFYGGNPKGGKQ